jgi:hydrogenase maturation protein HypF
MGITGFVRNQGDAGVLIVAEGPKKTLEKFLSDLHSKKPYIAKYEDFQTSWTSSSSVKSYNDFTIEKSSQQKVGGISYIPPDIGICQNCLNDINNPERRYYHYPFTACAICGPRFTTITDLPYDRPNTTMVKFPLCDSCLKEYEDPLNRRHHAQTTCCPNCGPQISLYNKDGKKLIIDDIFSQIAKWVENGKIIAIKGIGGTHLACSAKNDDAILKLRTIKGKRKYKPFALMAQTLEKIKSFAKITNQEAEILTSFRKPIVLLKKKNPFHLSKWISPNLHNVGVMLPYSGIHYLLLREINEPAIILTSANLTNQPMLIENQNIIEKAKIFADYFLLHNRPIYQRADDSVIRITNNTPQLIRRSRGWVPEPITLPIDLKDHVAVGFGPMLTSTGAVASKNRCFPTQFIGDVDTLETLDFLDSATQHMLHLLELKEIHSVGYDLHPTYHSRKLAMEYAQKYQAKLFPVQHHFAHAIALMIDNKVPFNEDIITIIADGVGYGADGKIWGGEIFYNSYSQYERIGHLKEQKMIGGDRATYYPLRMLISILSEKYSSSELYDILSSKYSQAVPEGIHEIQVIQKQLDQEINIAMTSSTGRILATLSTLLHACYERTYEGEPALTLESLAWYGDETKVSFDLPEPIDGVIDTTALVHQAFLQLQEGKKPADIAKAAHLEIGNQFAKVAIKSAKEYSVKKIGFTGGVAYNQFITKQLDRKISSKGLTLLQHHQLPCGDGCISTGQAFLAAIQNKENSGGK